MMGRLSVLLGTAMLGIMPACDGAVATASQYAAAVEWGYYGEIAPVYWGSLDPVFATCDTGRAQSPIDISAVVEVDDGALPRPRFSYSRSAVVTAKNVGYSVRGDVEPQDGRLRIGATDYSLLQFHFHTPSEHHLGGASFPMELHLVHEAADGSLAVVGVFIVPGATPLGLRALFDDLPADSGDTRLLESFNLTSLLPSGRTSFRYVGSLTTPPCAEGVTWEVLTSPIELRADHIQAISDIFSGDHFPGGNYRPLQDLHGRVVRTQGD